MGIPTIETLAMRQPRRTRFRRKNLIGYFFVAPFMVIFLIFQLIPIGYAIWQSLQVTTRSGLGIGAAGSRYAGLENFARALGDQEFISGILRMLAFGVV